MQEKTFKSLQMLQLLNMKYSKVVWHFIKKNIRICHDKKVNGRNAIYEFCEDNPVPNGYIP